MCIRDSASGGWTIYPPLSALGEASDGAKIGMDLWLVSIAMFIISVLLGGLNYIATILNMRTKGMSMTRLPLTIWAFFFTAVLGLSLYTSDAADDLTRVALVGRRIIKKKK